MSFDWRNEKTISQQLDEAINEMEHSLFIPQRDYIALRQRVRAYCGHDYYKYIERFYLIPTIKIRG